MSAEFWAVIGIGVTLLIAFAAGQRDTARRLDELNTRLHEINTRLSRLEGRFEEMRSWSKDLVDALLRRPAA